MREGFHADAQAQVDAVVRVQFGADRAEHRAQRAFHRHRGGLDDRHVVAEQAAGGRHLGADPARADDHDPDAGTQICLQRKGIVNGAQRVDTGQGFGARQRAGAAAGGDHDAVRAQNFAGGQVNRARRGVDPLGTDAEVPLRAEVLVGQREVLGRQRAREERLGQRRPVVGRVHLFADHHDPAVEALPAQLLDGTQPGERGTDDGDRSHATASRLPVST